VLLREKNRPVRVAHLEVPPVVAVHHQRSYCLWGRPPGTAVDVTWIIQAVNNAILGCGGV